VGFEFWGGRPPPRDSNEPPLVVPLTELERFELSQRAWHPQVGSAFFDQMLLEVSQLAKYPGDDPRPVRLCVLAARVGLPTHASDRVVAQLADDGLLKIRLGAVDAFSAVLTPRGWQRVDELATRRDPTRRAFLAMWFDPSMAAASDAIQTMLVQSGYEPPFRVDDPEHDAPADGVHIASVSDRIIAEIRRSRFIIADFTGQRPSVYYEAGFAEGLGIHVFSCCRADEVDKLAFDRRNLEHVLWTDPKELAEKLLAKIDRKGWRWI
jgi:hypothetical protein